MGRGIGIGKQRGMGMGIGKARTTYTYTDQHGEPFVLTVVDEKDGVAITNRVGAGGKLSGYNLTHVQSGCIIVTVPTLGMARALLRSATALVGVNWHAAPDVLLAQPGMRDWKTAAWAAVTGDAKRQGCAEPPSVQEIWTDSRGKAVHVVTERNGLLLGWCPDLRGYAVYHRTTGAWLLRTQAKHAGTQVLRSLATCLPWETLETKEAVHTYLAANPKIQAAITALVQTNGAVPVPKR